MPSVARDAALEGPPAPLLARLDFSPRPSDRGGAERECIELAKITGVDAGPGSAAVKVLVQ